MNQEKIGKFIAVKRKQKKLTQTQLGEKLGVSDRSISKWETGKCMPDLSLFEPLCKELDISVNELFSGEQIASDDYQEKSEENLINAIDYSTHTIEDKNKTISYLFIFFGLGIIVIAFSVLSSDSSWGSIFAILGVVISYIGFSKLIRKNTVSKRIFMSLSFLILLSSSLMILDYSSVVINHVAPRFSYSTLTKDNTVFYQTPFYNVFRINKNSINQYYVIDHKKEYSIDTVPTSPFNRDWSGIDTLIQYKNEYIGDNSNNGNLIDHLPLSEQGYTFEIDSKDLGLLINYHRSEWYNNDNYSVERALVYNSVSIFMLIDNVQYITFNFSGSTYTVDRTTVKSNYPNYLEVLKDATIDKDSFNQYVEALMSDRALVTEIFEKLFNL